MIGNLYKFFFYLTKSQVGKNSFLSVAQTLIGMVCMFAAYKMLVFFVGIKQLGLWALLISGVSFARLADFTGASSLGRFVAGFELSDSKASVFIETVLLSTTFINIVACAILWVFSDLIIFHFFKEFNVENIKFLIPFALISSVLLPSISLALSSALDGTQRSDRRSMLTIASYIFFLINVFILVPRYGILGYGISQINQQVFLIIVLWAALKHHFQELSLIPCHFSREAFLSSFDFGLKVQLNSLAAYLSKAYWSLPYTYHGLCINFFQNCVHSTN